MQTEDRFQQLGAESPRFCVRLCVHQVRLCLRLRVPTVSLGALRCLAVPGTNLPSPRYPYCSDRVEGGGNSIEASLDDKRAFPVTY